MHRGIRPRDVPKVVLEIYGRGRLFKMGLGRRKHTFRSSCPVIWSVAEAGYIIPNLNTSLEFRVQKITLVEEQDDLLSVM